MLDAIPCADCAYLVGAGPRREPHGALVATGKDIQGRDAFRCQSCEFRWSLGAAGWSRLLG